MQSFQNYIDRLGLVKAELKMWPGAKHSWCGKCFDQTVSIHSSDCDCNAKRLERQKAWKELGARRTIEFNNSGTASGISRSRLNEIQDRSWTGSRVDGLDGTTLCMGELDVSLEKRKIGEPDINLGGRQAYRQTPKRWDSQHVSSAGNENLLAGCIAVVNKLLCDTPSVDLSRDRTALSGKFLEDELKASRELDEFWRIWIGGWVASRKTRLWHGLGWWMTIWPSEVTTLCATVQSKGAQRWFVCVNARHVFIKYWLAKAASCKGFGLLVVDISVAFMHTRTDEEIYVKVFSGIKSSRFWRLKAAVNGTRKHQSTGKISHATSSWQICFSTRTTSIRVFTRVFFRQFGPGTARRRFSGVWINIQCGRVGR